MKRRRLADGDIVDHPRLGVLTISMVHRPATIPPYEWRGWRNDESVAATPSFYSERGLHFYLRRASWTKPPYLVKGNPK